MTDFHNVEQDWRRHRPRNRVQGGLFLLLVGGVLLAKQLGAPLPDWLFTWPMILVLVGLFIGIKLRFRNPGWIIPTLIGLVFLADQVGFGYNLKPYLFPIIIMGIGLLFILRPKGWHGPHSRRWHYTEEPLPAEQSTGAPEVITDRNDIIDATAVFGGVKKIVLSKSFKGGDITNFMGGSEINLTQADFTGRIKIDTTNIFGGTKLIVPAHWEIQNDVVAVFGGVDDKRKFMGVQPDPNKVLLLDGTCLFGGIEINSY